MSWNFHYWDLTLLAFHIGIRLITCGHAVLTKRDSRASLGWSGVIWLAPWDIGPLLYLLFGVNRIARRALSIRADRPQLLSVADLARHDVTDILDGMADELRHLQPLVDLVGQVTQRPLTLGNRVTPLLNGDEAYPDMLAAIEGAQRSVTLATYIFAHDPIGRNFLGALQKAVERGVEVRVLIDAVGARYSWPTILRPLHRARIPTAEFLPTRLPLRMQYANLRNHRKLMVVDGTIGFTGGMNIREAHVLSRGHRRPIQDLHFRLEGPVVTHLQEAFIVDWAFAAQEILDGPAWIAEPAGVGDVVARGIADGPDEEVDPLRMTMLGAIGCARKRLLVVTPYFVPDESLLTALSVAALRGVEVDIVLPKKCNLAWVQWASGPSLPELIRRGCRVWHSHPPFDHTKVVVIDDIWTLLGSANWDARSLRLNFEFNVECYSASLAKTITQRLGERIATSEIVTLESLENRSLALRLRDGIARLASPYL